MQVFVQNNHFYVHISQMHCRPGNGSMYSTFTLSLRLLWTCLQSNASTLYSNRVQSTANDLLSPDNLGHFFN